MAVTKIPPSSSLTDEQFIQVEGPNSLTTAFQYDAQTRSLWFKESQVLFPSFHGQTHIAEDPIPAATCDTPGLMAANDKCKLDALLQTRIGVLGFQGAGFPDDGGWLHGDIILAAGTEFISLERIGNVVRFTVDSPVPLNCACEECQQIFWVQDETDVSAIRPPTCGGKLPGSNTYGEMKVYLFPEATIADPNNVATTLNNKGSQPSLIFKRFDDSIVPGAGEYELVLQRDSTNQTQTQVGWAFTPGAAGVPECVWFTGKDNEGNFITFELNPESEPGLLGGLLYKGHLLTKKMGVVTDYTSTILSTNQYTCKFWDVDGALATGETFTATNVWQYANPENDDTGESPKTLILDGTIDLLPVGTLVDIWFFKVSEVSGEDIRRYYFSKKPSLNPLHLWSLTGAVQFGDLIVAREELLANSGSDDIDAAVQVSAKRDIEQTLWGITGFDDPLLSFAIASTEGTEAADLTTQHRAVIDTAIPALKVVASENSLDHFSERPVWLWNRRNVKNGYLALDIGRPSSSSFTPFDVVVRSPIDSHTNLYMKVVAKGTVSNQPYIAVKGVHFHDLPSAGVVRVLTDANKNEIYEYNRKFMFPDSGDLDVVYLAGDDVYTGAVGDVVELLHQEYNSTAVRVEFSYDSTTELIQLQFKVGTLDMSLPYEEDESTDLDDYVRGLAGGYTVSAVYSQSGTFSGVGTQPDATPSDFTVYDGGTVVGGTLDEYWNRLEIMFRDGQVWVWWNGLLIPPSTNLSAVLDTPVDVETPYFPITTDVDNPYGKVGLRMWPQATIRRMVLRSQLASFSEFSYGQLEVS